MSTTGLSQASLHTVAAGRRPTVRPSACPILHLGPGPFHRAHQAAYTNDVIASGHREWGITAASSRSDATVDALERQDGLFTVATRSSTDAFEDIRIFGSIGAWRRRDELVDAIASDEFRLVTMTVTEAAYRPPRENTPDRNDLIMSIVNGLLDRWRRGGAPIGFLSCDNLVSNGDRLRRVVEEVAGRADAAQGFSRWMEANVSFASSVVDRIVPAPQPAERSQVAAALGVVDELAVVTEPFRMWVFEDHFAAGRPPWETAGAIPVSDTEPYEHLKLRVLNAAHSLTAYLGILTGHRLVSEAIGDPRIEAAVTAMQEREAIPTLGPLGSVEPAAYARVTRERFGNPTVPYTVAQVASGGSVKIPERVLPMVADLRAAGRLPHYSGLTLAAWIRSLELAAATSTPIDDPIASALLSQCRGQEASKLVASILSVLDGESAEIVGEDQEFVDLVADQLDLIRGGQADPLMYGQDGHE
ncbi:MAG: mannitol dehydrogenase family protein [Actinomycetota bacterium]